MPDTRDEILARMLDNINDKYDKSEGSFFYDAEIAAAIEAERLYIKISEAADRAFVQTASGTDLDNKLAEIGMSRIPASYATGEVTITGQPNKIIPKGVIVKSDTLLFTITESGLIDISGNITLPAVCNTAGRIGNVPAGAINSLIGTWAAVVTDVRNLTDFVGGSDMESDEAARTRYLKYVKRPPTSGNKYHYEEWALEASSEVGEAKCIPLWDNDPDSTPGEVAGNVTVLILDNSKSPASSTLVNTVKAYIDTQKPIGANVIVAPAEALAINLSIELSISSGFDIDTIKENIKQAISNYLKQFAFKESEVSYAQIGSCVLSVPGVTDYENMTVNGGTINIDIAENQVAVMGVLTIAD